MKKLFATVALAIIAGTAMFQGFTPEKPIYILEALVIADSLPSEMQLKALDEMEAPNGIDLRIQIYNALEYAQAEPEMEIASAPCLILRSANGAIINQKAGYMPAQMVTSWIEGK